jgi:crossover junction endodeoxyribonuclease RuvC
MNLRSLIVNNDEVIVGIDPGSRTLGFAIFGLDGSLIKYGEIKLEVDLPIHKRLLALQNDIRELFDQCPSIKSLAVEDGFILRKNMRTSMLLTMSRAIVLVEGARCGAEVFMYPPSVVKKSVTGYGRADKKTIKQTVKRIYGIKKIRENEADAICIALCHIKGEKEYD